MLREAYNHPKFLRLARVLQIPLGYARGVVISLWSVAGIHHPDGAVGRFSNEELAVALGFEEEEGQRLVEALLQVRLLDALPEDQGRLYVHDWHHYADEYTRQKLRNRELTFANGEPPYGSGKRRKKAAPDTAPDAPAEETVAPAPRPAAETAPPPPRPAASPEAEAAKPARQRASELWEAGGRAAYLAWNNELLPSARVINDWVDRVETLLASGFVLTAEDCMGVTAECLDRYRVKRAAGENPHKTIEWWFSALGSHVERVRERERAQARAPAPDPAPYTPPPPAPRRMKPEAAPEVTTAATPLPCDTPPVRVPKPKAESEETRRLREAIRLGEGSPAWSALTDEERKVAVFMTQRQSDSQPGVSA